MKRPLYSADHIKVLRFEDSVRKRPAMYFRVGQQSPDLPTEVLRTVIEDALHTNHGEHRNVSVEIAGDLRFTVTDDQEHVTDEHGIPQLGFFGSLLDQRRWAPAASAALSSHTTIETWMGGRGFRQRLVGTQPVGAPKEFSPPTLQGTRATFDLDPTFFAPGATICGQPQHLEVHGEWCAEKAAAGTFSVSDMREL